MESDIINNDSRLQYKRILMIRVKELLSILLAFLLSMAFVGIALLMTIQLSCFNTNSFYRILKSCNYHENVASDIYQKAEAITLPTGLSMEVLDNVFEDYEIHRDVNGYIEAAFCEKVYQIDTSNIKSKLQKNVYNFLELNGIEPDLHQRVNLEDYMTAMTEEYIGSMKVPMINYIVKLKKEYEIIQFMGMVICSSIIILIIIMLIKLKHRVRCALRYIVYSTLAAAIMLAIVPLVILYSGVYTRIQLSPQYFYDFVMQYIIDIIHTLLNISLCFAVLSLILMITEQGIKSKRRIKVTIQ